MAFFSDTPKPLFGVQESSATYEFSTEDETNVLSSSYHVDGEPVAYAQDDDYTEGTYDYQYGWPAEDEGGSQICDQYGADTAQTEYAYQEQSDSLINGSDSQDLSPAPVEAAKVNQEALTIICSVNEDGGNDIDKEAIGSQPEAALDTSTAHDNGNGKLTDEGNPKVEELNAFEPAQHSTFDDRHRGDTLDTAVGGIFPQAKSSEGGQGARETNRRRSQVRSERREESSICKSAVGLLPISSFPHDTNEGGRTVVDPTDGDALDNKRSEAKHEADDSHDNLSSVFAPKPRLGTIARRSVRSPSTVATSSADDDMPSPSHSGNSMTETDHHKRPMNRSSLNSYDGRIDAAGGGGDSARSASPQPAVASTDGISSSVIRRPPLGARRRPAIDEDGLSSPMVFTDSSREIAEAPAFEKSTDHTVSNTSPEVDQNEDQVNEAEQAGDSDIPDTDPQGRSATAASVPVPAPASASVPVPVPASASAAAGASTNVAVESRLGASDARIGILPAGVNTASPSSVSHPLSSPELTQLYPNGIVKPGKRARFSETSEVHLFDPKTKQVTSSYFSPTTTTNEGQTSNGKYSRSRRSRLSTDTSSTVSTTTYGAESSFRNITTGVDDELPAEDPQEELPFALRHEFAPREYDMGATFSVSSPQESNTTSRSATYSDMYASNQRSLQSPNSRVIDSSRNAGGSAAGPSTPPPSASRLVDTQAEGPQRPNRSRRSREDRERDNGKVIDETIAYTARRLHMMQEDSYDIPQDNLNMGAASARASPTSVMSAAVWEESAGLPSLIATIEKNTYAVVESMNKMLASDAVVVAVPQIAQNGDDLAQLKEMMAALFQ